MARWLLLISFLAACANDPLDDDEVHVTYEGEHGPEHWGALDEAWATCGDGQAQSPVDLPVPEDAAELSELSFDYGVSAVHLFNNGHTIQYVMDAGSTVTLDGTTWTLKQAHFHASSEHTVDGDSADMEVHLVHEGPGGALLVLGGFIVVDDEHPELAGAAWGDFPADGETEDHDLTIDPLSLVPVGQAWRCDGSLTTPPWTEGVRWIVHGEPLLLSQTQVDAFTALYPDNHRPTQQLNGRALAFGE